MNINLKNYPVYINNKLIYANSASISENISFIRGDELGYGDVKIIKSSRPQGKASINFYLTSGILNLLNITGSNFINFKIGNFGYQSGFLESLEISASPFSLIDCSMSIVFFDKFSRNLSFDNINEDLNVSKLAHSSFSEFKTGKYDIIAQNISSNSFNISFSQNFTPYFKLGSNDLIGLDSQGEIDCSIQGTGLQNSISSECEDNVNIILNMKNLCNSQIENIRITGLKIQDSSVSINEDGLVGAISLKGFY